MRVRIALGLAAVVLDDGKGGFSSRIGDGIETAPRGQALIGARDTF